MTEEEKREAEVEKAPYRESAREEPLRNWGFPAFAADFPDHPELAALVKAFANGDYAAVREGAPKLAAESDDEKVKAAAKLLRARIEPDPAARVFFGLTAALLVFLSIYWMTHDGKTHEQPKEPPPKVEIVK